VWVDEAGLLGSRQMAKLFDLARQRTTLFDQCADVIPRDVGATRAKLCSDGVEIVAEAA